MSTTITNYDGSIVIAPQQLVRPESVEEIQDQATYRRERNRERSSGSPNSRVARRSRLRFA
jgi:hypothetical protein